ncbi:dephospho-CoA kinase [Christensenellaceae bacterium]|nr:dephospho-CoA kinase [Christensenellaceae bacterium]BDF61336.1 dephospho-CoA kinase [Christensenellaceae bacterium]
MGGSEVKKRIIGLMGNSGSGKSTVAAYLKRMGARIVDADQIARDLSKPGQAGWRAVKQGFGEAFFHGDGTLDRHKLGEYVFARPGELKRLNGLLHPLVLQKVNEEIGRAGEKTIVIDCALLVDVGLDKLADEVWLVSAARKSKLERIKNRDNLSSEHAENRLKSQLPEKELKRYADVVLENKGTLDELFERVRKYYG